jgi:hypothetical protein
MTKTRAILAAAAATLLAIAGVAWSQTYQGQLPANTVLGNGTGGTLPFASPLTTIPTAAMPALTGDVTSSAGTVATSLGWISRVSGKSLTLNNTLTLAGTDSTTMTFPSSNANVAALNIQDQTVSGGANVTSLSLSTGNVTIDCGSRPLQFITNGGAFTITAPANDGSCLLLSTNNASAGAITFSGFSVGSNTGDALDTTNGHKFTINIWRINGTSGYRVAAHQ